LKKHPIQELLDSQGIRTYAFHGRLEGEMISCLGAYCTLGGLLRAVSTASSVLNNSDLSVFITDIAEAKSSGRLFYWPNIKFVEWVKV
jgi:hypothetical protein